MSETAPTTVNRTLSLRRKTNAEYRPREYLTEGEVTKLLETARKRGRNGARDVAAIRLAYRHGLIPTLRLGDSRGIPESPVT